MRIFISLIIITLFLHCKNAQRYSTEVKNSLKDTIMFEKFDSNLWNTRYKDFEKDPKYGGYYKLKDGSSFRPMYGGENYTFYDVIPPLPAYFIVFMIIMEMVILKPMVNMQAWK